MNLKSTDLMDWTLKMEIIEGGFWRSEVKM